MDQHQYIHQQSGFQIESESDMKQEAVGMQIPCEEGYDYDPASAVVPLVNPEQQQQEQNKEDMTKPQVTYYFRDSDQSEWSSSDDEEKGEKQNPLVVKLEGTSSEVKAKKSKYQEDMLEEEDDGGIDALGENMRTKNELKPVRFDQLETTAERLVRYGVHFQGSEKMSEIGSILSIVDGKIIIATDNDAKDADSRLIMDLDHVIFNADKLVIGTVDDVFGNIKNPFYSILIDKYVEELITTNKVANGMKMYMIEGFSKILMQAQLEFLMQQKGCDASNRFDEEVVNTNEIEYSDDELETRNKQKKNASKNRRQDLESAMVESEGDEDDDEFSKGNHVIPSNTNKHKDNNNNNNKNKKIMVMKNENGILRRLFLKPSEFEQIKNNPNNKIQQLPSGMLPGSNHHHAQQRSHGRDYNNNNSHSHHHHHQQQQQQQHHHHHQPRQYQNQQFNNNNSSISNPPPLAHNFNQQGYPQQYQKPQNFYQNQPNYQQQPGQQQQFYPPTHNRQQYYGNEQQRFNQQQPAQQQGQPFYEPHQQQYAAYPVDEQGRQPPRSNNTHKDIVQMNANFQNNFHTPDATGEAAEQLPEPKILESEITSEPNYEAGAEATCELKNEISAEDKLDEERRMFDDDNFFDDLTPISAPEIDEAGIAKNTIDFGKIPQIRSILKLQNDYQQFNQQSQQQQSRSQQQQQQQTLNQQQSIQNSRSMSSNSNSNNNNNNSNNNRMARNSSRIAQ